MRKILLLAIAIVLSIGQLAAQQARTVTGEVKDQSGNPVANASILLKGSASGTSTNEEGKFSLAVPANAKALIISAVGLATREVSIDNKNSVSVTLTVKDNTMTEVVVTALGISRDKRSLGYATQSLKGDQLVDKGDVNILSALQGKVSGVNITGASGSAGASVNINIRGMTSFQNSNQPLFVVDGIPISNDVDRTNGGPNGTLGDNQPANRALDLDLNNIESVNILKGPTAASLYGSRAAGGAIIITTKKGSSRGKGGEVSVSSSYSLQNATGLPKVQNEYGQGLGGVYNPVSTNSWGPRFGSTPSIANGLIVSGSPVSYKAYPNNIKDFFETGNIWDNNLTINGGDAKQNYTFSGGYLNQTGILPNTALKRANIKFGANTVIRDRIKLGGSMNVINTLQDGILGGNGQSALGVLAGLARSIDLTSYKTNGTYKNIDGSNNFVIPNTENPYFGAYENPLKSNLYRFIGNITAGVDVLSWLNVSYRLGVDAYTDRRKQVFAVGSGRVPAGQVLENPITRSEVNGDLIVTVNRDNFFAKDLHFTGLLGQNINQRRFQTVQVQADALAVAGFYNASNGTSFAVGSLETNSIQRLVGHYAQLSFGYRNYLFLELTGRVDQSSTLPKGKNQYFYPSASLGFVFTDGLGINSDVLSYGKIRGSFAKVGRDAPVYQLENYFVSASYGNNVASFSFPYGGVAGFGRSSRIGSGDNLSPEFVNSYEVGLNLGLLKNKISVDLAYFESISKNQILNVGIAPSTGYTSKTTNVGKMTNKGVEALVNITPVSTRTFRWDVSGNFTKIVNKVEEIAPGIESFSIPGSGFTGSIASIKKGAPYGVILGGVIPIDSATGQRIINPATGVYQPTIANQILSDPNPDYSLGVTNTVKYKNLSLGFSFDFTKGGQILSFTSALYKSRGVLKETAVDRDKPRVLPGVIQTSPGKFIPNNIQIPAQTYWQTLGGLQSEFNVYDATVFRMRDISLSYDVPSTIVNKLKINGIRFTVFANNVFFVAPNCPIDPSVNTQGAGNIRGLELQSAPNARTMGASIKLSL